MSDTMELRDLVGPYSGQIRTYLRHAGENALVSGFAEVPVSEVPDDFPAREELAAAGYETLESVPRAVDELTALPGIGKKTAGKILEALG